MSSTGMMSLPAWDVAFLNLLNIRPANVVRRDVAPERHRQKLYRNCQTLPLTANPGLIGRYAP